MEQEFRGVFKGIGSTSICLCKEKDDKLFVLVSNKVLPFVKSWRPVGGNLKDMLKNYETRPWYNVRTGEREKDVRFYNFSLEDLREDASQMNHEIIRELNSYKSQSEFLANLVVELKDVIDRASIEDRVMQNVLDKYEIFVKKIRAPYLAAPQKDKKKRPRP